MSFALFKRNFCYLRDASASLNIKPLNPSTSKLLNSTTSVVGGFSLLEIIVALALFAIAVMSLLQLFPTALKFNRDTQSAANATAIAQTIFSKLQVSAPDGILMTSRDGFTNPNHSVSFSLEQNSTHDIGYDSSDQAVRLLTAEEITSPLSEKEITCIAHIVVTNDEVFQNVAHVEVSISSPANQPERLRHHFVFCELVSTLSHDEKE